MKRKTLKKNIDFQSSVLKLAYVFGVFDDEVVSFLEFSLAHGPLFDVLHQDFLCQFLRGLWRFGGGFSIDIAIVFLDAVDGALHLFIVLCRK